MNELDLNTLKQIKQMFQFCSDHSTNCMGYGYICRKIEEIEKEQLSKKINEENAFDDAELMIEVLNEHRT